MQTRLIYDLALVTHLVGLTLMAGTTILSYLFYKRFWMQFAIDRSKGIAIHSALSGTASLFGIGFLLLILSGVTMMFITHGAFGEQTWFRIKFGLILIIVLNALLVGRRQGRKLRKYLASTASDDSAVKQFLKLKGNINLFLIAQMLLFLIIFILSVFKFN